MSDKYSKFYDTLYKKSINLNSIREQKIMSPSKRMKREIFRAELARLPFNSKIVEIGSGLGDVIGPLKYKNKLGIDISREAVIKSKKLFPECQFKVGDANKKLSLRSKEYDAVILADVIEHVKKDGLLIKETNRILKKNGILIIMTPYSGMMEDKTLVNPLDKKSFGIGGDLRDYGWNLISRVENNGFKIIKARYLNGLPGKIIWDIKERVLGKNKQKVTEEIMTGNFMNSSSTKRITKKIISEALFWIYYLNYKLFSNKNKPGIIIIVAKKNE